MSRPHDPESITASPNADAIEEPAQQRHRSRLQRFSPAMGWPAFWSEILIVSLGVLIALAANEAVQEWNWHHKVKDAEARLKQDVDSLFVWYAELAVTQPCVDAQLEALGRRVLSSGDVLQPAPTHRSNSGTNFVVRMPARPYVFGTWEALVADGTATHFGRDRQGIIDRIARATEGAREFQFESQRLVGRLQVMRDAITLDPGVMAAVLTDINQLRLLGESSSASARQQMTLLTQAFGSPSADRLDAFLQGGPDRTEAWLHSGTVAFCKAQGLPLADWRSITDSAAIATRDRTASEATQ